MVLLAAPHLSVTLCLSYICAASVSRLGSSPAKMTISDALLLSYVSICPVLLEVTRHETFTHVAYYTFSMQTRQAGGFIDSSHTAAKHERAFVPQVK